MALDHHEFRTLSMLQLSRFSWLKTFFRSFDGPACGEFHAVRGVAVLPPSSSSALSGSSQPNLPSTDAAAMAAALATSVDKEFFLVTSRQSTRNARRPTSPLRGTHAASTIKSIQKHSLELKNLFFTDSCWTQGDLNSSFSKFRVFSIKLKQTLHAKSEIWRKLKCLRVIHTAKFLSWTASFHSKHKDFPQTPAFFRKLKDFH